MGVAVCGLPIVITAGWWYARNQLVYGDVFGLTLFRSIYQQTPLHFGQISTWQQAFSQLMRSGWGMYGWMSLAAPDWWLQIGTTVTISAPGRIDNPWGARRPIAKQWWLLAAIWLVASIWLTSFAYTVGPVAWQMRLVMIAVPAGALLFGQRLSDRHRDTPQAHPDWARGIYRHPLSAGYLVGVCLAPLSRQYAGCGFDGATLGYPH
jgi:hypothetical protein